ncbi:hypothetical protein CLAFUW4_11865 [Fulvia fulva]|nr:hypothetical protein CLAFUR4_11870 [Fulvia fulva]WPV18510.1 hypothetical protein CLAFUW4_11865 [Fulvia fulva]WPV33627.1 hypothetical protein CLAFUW7_11872 [Fulvia fulva]
MTKGIMHAMRRLNEQEDTLTQALDRSLRHVKMKQAALAEAKAAHTQRGEVFKENLKKVKKRAAELNELLGCSKLMQQDDPEKHRRLLKPVILQDMDDVEEDDEMVERSVVKKKVGGKVSRGQREMSQARFLEQIKKGRISKLNAASNLRAQSQTSKMFDKADAARRGRTSRKNDTVPDEEDDSDSDTPPEERKGRKTIRQQSTGSEIEVARVDTPEDGNDVGPSTGDDPMHGTADDHHGESPVSRRGTSASGGGFFTFDKFQPRSQSDRRPATSSRARSDARRDAQTQDPAPQNDEAYDVPGDAPEPGAGYRSVKERGDGAGRFFGADEFSKALRDGFDDNDAESIASDSSDGLFVSERVPTPSSRGSTPDYMLRASPSPKPEATRYDETESGAHVNGAASSSSLKRIASRERFSPPPPQRQPQNTSTIPLPHAQLLEHFTMASRGDNDAPTPPDSGKRTSGEYSNSAGADLPVPSIEGADGDSIKSEDEDDDLMDTEVDRPKGTGLFTFEKYMPTARGGDQGEPTPRPAYAGPTWQERMYRVQQSQAAEQEDAQEEDTLNLPSAPRKPSFFSNTIKHPNNRSRLANSMTPEDNIRAKRGMPAPGYSDGTAGSPGAEEEFEDGEGVSERDGTEDPSSDFESTPKPRSKKAATGAKKGGRKAPRRAPGTRCGDCFRLHRKCTHTDPATGAGDDEDEDNADPRYLAMKARKRAAVQAGGSMPPPKRTHYNTYGPDPEPLKAMPKRNGGVASGLTFDIGATIAGKVLGDARKRKESSEEGTPEKEGTPGKKNGNEGNDDGEERGEDDEDEE